MSEVAWRLNQVPLTEKRLLGDETSDSRPLEEAGCCINEQGHHPSPVTQVYPPAWTSLSCM